MFLLASASGIARSFATLTLGGRDGGETRGPAGLARPRLASVPASPGIFTSLMCRAPRAAAPRWVAAHASPGGSGGGGGSSYGGNLSMDSSRDDSGARNDYWRGGAGGSEGRRGRGGGGRGSYERAEGDRGASPSRGARGRGRGDGKASYGEGRRGPQSSRGEHARGGSSRGGGTSSGAHASADRRHGGRGGRGGGSPPPGSRGGRKSAVEPASPAAAARRNTMRQHTTTLSSCETCDEVLEYAETHARTFTAVNFSTAIHKLGKLNRSARGRRTSLASRLIDDPRFLNLETALAASLALFASPDVSTHPGADEFHGVWGAREVSCALWGFANCGRTAEMFADNVDGKNPARGATTAHCANLFANLLRKVAAFDGAAFSSQNLSNAVWALAKMHSGPGALLTDESVDAMVWKATDSLEGAIRDRLRTPPKGDAFIPQGVSNSMWALAVLKKHEHQRKTGDGSVVVHDGDNRDASYGISAETARAFSEYILAPGSVAGFKSMELSNIIWAISTMRCVVSRDTGEALDEAVVRACDDAPHMFSTQSVANILWAAGNTPELVPLSTAALDRLAKMTYAKFPEFTTQGLANTLWGFAAANYNPGEGLFKEIRRAWVEKGDGYSVIELNNMLWAMHTLKASPGRKVFSSVHARVAALCAEDAARESAELTFNHVANFMYHMAQYEELPDPTTMRMIEETLLRKIAARGGEKTRNASVSASAARKAADAIQPHLVSNTLWAFSVLRYKPGESLMRAFDDLVEARVEEYSDQSLSMTIFAYANLAFEPKAETTAKLLTQCEERVRGGGFTPQGLSNSFWGWAVLGVATSALVEAYAARFAETSLSDSANSDNSDALSRVDLVQIYQASLAFAHCVERDGRLECSTDVSNELQKKPKNLLRGALLTRAKEVWEQTSTGRVTISSLHREVSETLTFMAIPHEIEAVADDNFSLDIALRGRAVAIEVDGPSHFFANRQSEYMGADKLREKVLEAKGWTVLRLPWHEWREDFGMDERCDYLANLLYRGAGLTVKDASVVPGGARAAGRAAFNKVNKDSEPFEDYSGEDDGMSGYVRRVVADPGSNVRINRAGSVIVEDNTFDDEARALRDSEYVPRVFSKDKPDARAGYEDGGYDPRKSEADKILKRVEAKRINANKKTNKVFGVVRGLADVAPYGMTLEPGARAARARDEKKEASGGETKSPYGGARTPRRRRGDDDANETNAAVRRPAPNRAASVRRRAPGGSAPERAAGAAGVIRRRRIRVSVPAASDARFAAGGERLAKNARNPRTSSEPAETAASFASSRASSDADADGDAGRKEDEPDDKNAAGDASLWSSASSLDTRDGGDVRNRGDAPVSALRGVGSKSAARLASFGVVSVGDLASLSDARCAEIRNAPSDAEKGGSVRGLRDKARRALGGTWDT